MYENVTTCERVDELIDSSKPVWLLKHSTTCSTSAWALREFTAYLETHPRESGAVIVVQKHRPVCDHVSQRLAVPHQSPQLLLVKRGKVLYRASHSQITAEAMAARRAVVTTA